MLPVPPTNQACKMIRLGAKKVTNRLRKERPQMAITTTFNPSMTELCRVAESRVHTTLTINRRNRREFEIELQKQQQQLWHGAATIKDDIKVSILSIMLDMLAGSRKDNTSSGGTTRQLALRQLDADMVSDNQSEEEWEWNYQQRHACLVVDGREDSEEAEMLTIMIETLELYRREDVFKSGEYCPSKISETDSRRKKEQFCSKASERSRNLEKQ